MSQFLLKIRQHWKWGMLLVPIGAVSVMLWHFWQGPEIIAESVVRRDFIQTVVASGHIETPHRVEISALITGSVKQVPVAEGQHVKAGQLLVELDNAELQANWRQTQAVLAQAQTRIREMQEVAAPVARQSLRQAQVNLDNARSVYRRNQDLFQRQFIGQAALDDARKAVDLADAQMQSAQKQFDATGPKGSDFAMTKEAMMAASAAEEAARVRANYAMIKAPVAGTLIARRVEAGDTTQPGKSLMTLAPDGQMQLVVQIDEKNMRLLKTGQSALASSDAWPQQRFAARLGYINPGVNVQTGAVEVKLDVVNPPAELKQDMTVSVDIEVARRPQALILASSAIHDPDSAAPWVLRVEQGHAVRRGIRVGLKSAGLAEILDGLAENDSVLPVSAKAAKVAHGGRVRAVAPVASATAPSTTQAPR